VKIKIDIKVKYVTMRKVVYRVKILECTIM